MPNVNKIKPGSHTGSSSGSRPGVREAPSSQGNVLDRISSIGFDEQDGIKILVYGQSGTGKTTFWSTFPKPILAIIVSGGDKPGELRSIDTLENRKTIKQVVLRESAEVGILADHIAESGAFKTVVLDHCTGFQDMVLAEILGLDELPVQKGWGQASQQQYGQCTSVCKEYFRKLLGLPCNVVMVSQEREFKVEGAEDHVMPSMGAGLLPSLAGWLNAATDYIVNTFKREVTDRKKVTIGKGPTAKTEEISVRTGRVEYCLRTGPHVVYTTKFRVPKGTIELPPYLSDPDYQKVYALIRGE